MKTKNLKPHLAAPVKREHLATSASLGQDASVDPSGFLSTLAHIASQVLPHVVGAL